MNKSFDLEAFKAGQKAFTRDGRVATFVGVCEGCEEFSRLLVLLEGDDQVMFFSLNGKFEQSIGTYNETRYDLVSIVSRHQRLIESYNPDDTWQVLQIEPDYWQTYHTGVEPEWDEECEYRLHPHNDLIKAYKKGAKIECKHKDKEWRDASSDDIRSWYEDAEYRIKPEPQTKTIYEWMYKPFGKVAWSFVGLADEGADDYFVNCTYRKTGHSWEVPL